MTVSSNFEALLSNLQIKNKGQIGKRYRSITRALNREFRDNESKTANSKQVGSYGRKSGINGISDLDMLYVLPDSERQRFKNNPSYLLQVVRNTIREVYKNTDIRGDGQVVVVKFKDYAEFEVCPVFLESDGRYKYPDSNDGGTWRKCNPNAELNAFKELNETRKGHLRYLSKMVRAWKNRNDVSMSGFLIDTLCYRFLQNNSDYDMCSFGSFDQLSLDFFTYLENEGEPNSYRAFGSLSKIPVKQSFHRAAKLARETCEAAISATTESEERKEWKKLYGRPFPRQSTVQKATSHPSGEQFIEDMYNNNPLYEITIECDVKKETITHKLSQLLGSTSSLNKGYDLSFRVEYHDIPVDFDLKWKVKNEGAQAIKKNCLRGQILDDDGTLSRKESTTFEGEHYVECYAIVNNTVIARDRITVPIS